MKDGAGKRLVTLDVALLGHRQTAHRADEKLAYEMMLLPLPLLGPVLAPQMPQTRIAIEPRLLDGGLEVEILVQIVFRSYGSKVLLELLLLWVERRPVSLGGERVRVDGGGYITCAARYELFVHVPDGSGFVRES